MTHFPHSGLLTSSCDPLPLVLAHFIPSDVHLLRPVSDLQTASPRSVRQTKLLLRWPVQRPSRALGKLEEVEEMVLSLATTPAAWSCLALSTTGPACSPLPPSPPALGLAVVLYTSTITTICTLCRLFMFHTHCLTPTQRARKSPRLTSSYLHYHHHQRLLVRHSAIGGERGLEVQLHRVPSQESSQSHTEWSTRRPPASRDLCLTCCLKMSTHPGLHHVTEPPEERLCRSWRSREWPTS